MLPAKRNAEAVALYYRVRTQKRFSPDGRFAGFDYCGVRAAVLQPIDDRVFDSLQVIEIELLAIENNRGN